MTRPAEAPVESWQDFVPRVREYLADCERARALLSPKYHPTADGAVKMIAHHGSPAAADKIRCAFRVLTGGTS